MSNIDTKAPVEAKSTPKKGKVAQHIEAALETAVRKTVKLSQLVLTDLNARKKESSPESIRELAASIKAVGLLQNLIVFDMGNGQLGVAAGGRRTLALRYLLSLKKEAERTTPRGVVDADYPVDVLVVSKDMARLISYTENGQREQMHPADRLAAFHDMSVEGRTPEQIGDLLGFSTAYIKKYLKLNTMAPALLAALAQDEISLDQLAALSATDDHERQVSVWKNATYYNNGATPKNLRERVLTDEVSSTGNSLAEFVGVEAYEAAGGETRQDLLAETVIMTEPMKLEQVAISKLNEAAAAVAQAEGWAWSLGRIQPIRDYYGEDEKAYRLDSAPTMLTQIEQVQITTKRQRIDEIESKIDETDDENDSGIDAFQAEIDNLEEEIDSIRQGATDRGWTDELRRQRGVVAYLDSGKILFHRGVMKVEDAKKIEKELREAAGENTPPTVKGFSAVLITSLSAERTLAVTAALAQNTTVALALHTFTLARKVFAMGYHSNAMHSSVEIQQSICLKQAEAADAENGLANQKLTELHESWLSRFPADWEHDFSWLLRWQQHDVMGLLAYCVSLGLDGVSCQLVNQRVADSLEPVEAALNFDIHEWWHPTAANYFSRISKDQLVGELESAGQSGKARDAEKMKRKDAAEFAESVLEGSGWIPVCMTRIEPQPGIEAVENTTDYPSSADAA
ncbi:ParB/RepB/Spo0J family partition protein [Acerihabitans sp. TG2]|uniref:ParB/RepB/Spo0J family partition protein n=1 Tax=Acerihabitans sp. TG2 TaxID=3096008 RepID=UPI002B22C2D6|nr:ParB/RepB/Spo0J family partition protein [Acerihabitans sp. TG2]MEA9392672.1 ParB/RepB/Spo0J family partition protein [Acerihabitans sp. TG2]